MRLESPRRYVESDVNIHYRCPVRHDPLPLVPERELARQQAEHMKRLYREQRRNKYLQVTSTTAGTGAAAGGAHEEALQGTATEQLSTGNIHYRCPVRHDPLPLVPERELARQQAEHMKRLYREQQRNKYLQDKEIYPSDIEAFDASIKELQDMQNRRHQDNFTPSQKNILPLNRYDEAEKVVAKALYTFNGQTTRELSFRKGEIIHIQKGDNPQPQKKPVVVEGRARAKFDFTAQTNLELPLKKGEVVVLTRRIDNNWWEGRNANKMGIFPDSYPVSSPAAHSLMNGSAKRSMGPHSYTPQLNSQALSNAPPATQPLPGYAAKPAQPLLTPSERGYGPPTGQGVDLNNTEPLYVDTNAEAIPEGDTVYVLEKCDDGWYVGSSQRTGRFGTFP
ncbi:CAP isoform A, partial [Operophtera brumata]